MIDIVFAVPPRTGANPSSMASIVRWPVVPRVGEYVSILDPHELCRNDGSTVRFVVSSVWYAQQMQTMYVEETIVAPTGNVIVRVSLDRLS